FHAVANFNVSVGMNDGAIADVKPSVAYDLRRGFGVSIVAFHDNIATNHDLAHRFTIVGNFDTFCVNDFQLPGCDQFHTLSGFDRGAVLKIQVLVFGPPFTNRDEGRGLRCAVHVSDLPTQLLFYQSNRRGCRWRSRCEYAHASAASLAHLVRSIGNPDKHSRGRAQHADGLLIDEIENGFGLDLSQANVSAANRGHDPHNGPSVGVEHRQRPQISIRT